MYQSHWNTSDYTRISTCPCYCRNVVPLTSRFQNLVSTADSQWGPVPCFVKKKMLVKSSQVSDVMSKFRIVTMKISSVVLSSQVFRRECDQQRTVLLGYWWLHETFLQCQIVPVQVYNRIKIVALCYREEVHNQTITAKWSQRSGLRLAKKSVPELPLPAM